MKIAICTPCYADPKAQFTVSLAHLLTTTLTAEAKVNDRPALLRVEFFMARGSDLAENRRLLVQKALDWGATYILFADADHTFPRDALLRLLSHNLPVVGCNYLQREAPHGSVALGLDRKPIATIEFGPVAPVASLGLGFCLIKSQIFNVLKQPWFRFEVADDGARTSEDTYLFRMIGEAGIPVHMDHALSWHIGHVGEQIITQAERKHENTARSASGP